MQLGSVYYYSSTKLKEKGCNLLPLRYGCVRRLSFRRVAFLVGLGRLSCEFVAISPSFFFLSIFQRALLAIIGLPDQ